MLRCVLCLMLALCSALPAAADQRVNVPVQGAEGQASFVDRAFDAALTQEIAAVLGTQLAQSRIETLMGILSKERDSLVWATARPRLRTITPRPTPQKPFAR